MAEGSKPPPRESAQPEKRFPQRYTVVEHHPSGASSIASAAAGSSSSRSTAIKRAAADTGNSSNSNNSNNQNHAAGRQSNTEDDAQRFSKNSLAMEERAKRDLRDTLLWVGHLSGGPVDRRLLREAARSMKPNTYRDVMTERWVGDQCAYPPCEKSSRKPYNGEKPIYRINLRAKKVFDTAAAMKFCSDECARRSIWYETVCLQQNAFEVPDLSQPVQLLEDTEGSPANTPTLATTSLTSEIQAEGEAGQRNASVPQPTQHSASKASDKSTLSAPAKRDEYENLADDFLNRLAIVERQPEGPPIPPSEDLADDVNTEDNPFSLPRGAMSLAPTAMQGQLTESSSSTEYATGHSGEKADIGIMEDNSAGLARRIEIDVDPEYRDLMDESWALYKQMKESGELT